MHDRAKLLLPRPNLQKAQKLSKGNLIIFEGPINNS